MTVAKSLLRISPSSKPEALDALCKELFQASELDGLSYEARKCNAGASTSTIVGGHYYQYSIHIPQNPIRILIIIEAPTVSYMRPILEATRGAGGRDMPLGCCLEHMRATLYPRCFHLYP